MSHESHSRRQTALGTVGSGNVFAGLGLPDPELRLLKSQLVAKIDEVIEKRGLTQVQAGLLMGLPQQKVSELRRGRTEDYCIDRLYKLLNNLGVSISVVMEERPDWTTGEVSVVEAAPAEADREPTMSYGM